MPYAKSAVLVLLLMSTLTHSTFSTSCPADTQICIPRTTAEECALCFEEVELRKAEHDKVVQSYQAEIKDLRVHIRLLENRLDQKTIGAGVAWIVAGIAILAAMLGFAL